MSVHRNPESEASAASGDAASRHDDDTAPTTPELSAESKEAVAAVRAALEEALREIETPEQADDVTNRLFGAIGDMKELEIRKTEGVELDPKNATRQVQEAANTPGIEKLHATLLEAARQVARGSGETRAAFEEAVQEATNPEQRGARREDTSQQRHWLLQSVVRRMQPFERLDTRAFLFLNGLPHTKLTNRFMHWFTSVMNGGGGWVLILLVATLVDKRRGRRALQGVLPPLWLATMAVEYPIKGFFRRRRPFSDVVEAVAVGKKPGSFSFPSGHSAAGFAGAWLLTRHYPQFAPLWYFIALLVGFSRIYVGVHYPGDVLSGAVTGTAIAEASRRLIEYSDEREPNPVVRIARRLTE